MNLPITKHEDDRRILTEWLSDIPVKRCKIIEVKQKCTLGNHYHLKNDNVFYMFKGKGQYTLKNVKTGKIERGWLFENEAMFVKRGTIHTFVMYPDSIMMEAATEIYDKEDEIQVTE